MKWIEVTTYLCCTFIGTHSNAQRSSSAVRPAEKLVFCLLYGPESSFISAARNPRKGTACPPASLLKYAQTAAIFGTLPKTKIQPRNQQYGLTRAAVLLVFLLYGFIPAVLPCCCTPHSPLPNAEGTHQMAAQYKGQYFKP